MPIPYIYPRLTFISKFLTCDYQKTYTNYIKKYFSTQSHVIEFFTWTVSLCDLGMDPSDLFHFFEKRPVE